MCSFVDRCSLCPGIVPHDRSSCQPRPFLSIEFNGRPIWAPLSVSGRARHILSREQTMSQKSLSLRGAKRRSNLVFQAILWAFSVTRLLRPEERPPRNNGQEEYSSFKYRYVHIPTIVSRCCGLRVRFHHSCFLAHAIATKQERQEISPAFPISSDLLFLAAYGCWNTSLSPPMYVWPSLDGQDGAVSPDTGVPERSTRTA